MFHFFNLFSVINKALVLTINKPGKLIVTRIGFQVIIGPVLPKKDILTFCASRAFIAMLLIVGPATANVNAFPHIL